MRAFEPFFLIRFLSLVPRSVTSTQQMRGPVTIHGSLLHMHTHGSAMRTRIIRNGKELPPISQRHYDSNYQAMVLADGRETIQPGDTLITECTWNTKGKKEAVRGGLATSEEMCFNFLNVYPASNVYLCLTTSDATNVALCPTVSGMGLSLGVGQQGNSTEGGGRFKISPQRLPAAWEPYDAGKEDCPAVYNQVAATTTKPSAGSRFGASLMVGLVAVVGAALFM